MKKTKRLLSLLLVLCMVLSMVPAALAVRTYLDEDPDGDGSGYPFYDVRSGGDPLIAYGTSFLIMSDIHDTQYEYNRLEKLLKKADPEKKFAAILHGGDYESGGASETDRRTVQEFNDIVDEYYKSTSKNMIVMHTMGNHERKDTDDKFASYVGWPRTGHVITGYEENADPDNDDPIYFVYALSWYGEGGTNTSTGEFSDEELEDFADWMDDTAQEYSNFYDIPVFVISHTPIHYYTANRSTINSEAAVETLNDYSNVIFTWGHNHTEADPMYTNILEPGDVITYGRGTAEDPIDTLEILFNYAGMGAGRANGHLNELGFRVDVDPVNNTVSLQYYRLDGTDVVELNGSTTKLMDSDTTLVIKADSEKTITTANVLVKKPRAGDTVDGSAEVFSDRFDVGNVTWNPTPSVIFAYATEYTATITLTETSNFEFPSDINGLVVYINGEEATYISADSSAGTVTYSYTFPATAAALSSGEYPLLEDLSEDIDENTFALVAGDFDAMTADFTSTDVFVGSDEVVTEVDDASVWTAYAAAGGGFYLYNNESKAFLSAEIRTPPPNKPDEMPSASFALSQLPTTVWDIDNNGNLFMTYSGSSDDIYFYPYLSGYSLFGTAAFSMIDADSIGDEDLICLYQISDATGTVSFISFNIDNPVAGELPGEPESADTTRYDVYNYTWADKAGNPVNDTFDYDTVYVATIVLEAQGSKSTFVAVKDDLVVMVNGVRVSNNNANYDIDVDEKYLMVTITFNRTLHKDAVENEVGQYGKFVEDYDFNLDEGFYVIAANEDADDDYAGYALTSAEIRDFDVAQLDGTDVYLDNNSLYLSKVTTSMVWYSDGNGGLYPLDYYDMVAGCYGDLALYGSSEGLELSADDATAWQLDGSKLKTPKPTSGPPEQQISYYIAINEAGLFETTANAAEGVDFSFYRLILSVPVTVFLDDDEIGLNEAIDEHLLTDGFMVYNGDVCYPSRFILGSGGSIEEAFLELDWDLDFYKSAYPVYVEGYRGFYTSDDQYLDGVYATTFTPAWYGDQNPIKVDSYSINVYDGKNLVDRQIVLKGYMGDRGVYTKKGYRAELYYRGTNIKFRFDRPITGTTDVEIKWIELEDDDDKTTVSAPSSTGSALQKYLGAQAGDSSRTPAQILAGFTDIQGHWAQAQIEFVVMRGLFNGKTETLFAPDDPMTRGMLVTVLYRNSNSPAVSGYNGFHDVETGVYYNDPITWAAANGIVEGFSDSQFGPNNNITREQLATILYRYAAYVKLDTSARGDLSGFADAGSVSDWANEALQWCVANGIITGKPGAVIDPQGNATRAEVATMLQRFISFAGF